MASERAGGAGGPPTRDEIEAFAADWYRKLDEHVPAADIVPLVLDQGLEFVVPEATLVNREQFGWWYAGGGGHPGVINLFFDEVHTLSRVEPTPRGRAGRGHGRCQLAGPALDGTQPAQPVDRLRCVPDLGDGPLAGNEEPGDRPLCRRRTAADAGLAATLMASLKNRRNRVRVLDT